MRGTNNYRSRGPEIPDPKTDIAGLNYFMPRDASFGELRQGKAKSMQRRPHIVFLLIMFLLIWYINTEMEFMKVQFR
jgi:hypothetical protein